MENKTNKTKPEIVDYPIINGKYKHYKGGIYEVLTMATYSDEDETKLVIYKSLLFGSVHARPLTSWNETVSINKFNIVPRFRLIV